MNHYKKSVKKWIAIAISMAMVLTSVLTGNVTTGSAASAPKLNFSKKTVTAGRKVTLKVKKKQYKSYFEVADPQNHLLRYIEYNIIVFALLSQ